MNPTLKTATFSITWDQLHSRLTPVALAVALLPSAILAQPLLNPSTPATTKAASSADLPEAKSLFETGGQADIGPRPFNSILSRLSSPVDVIRLTSVSDNLPADGVGVTEVSIQLFDSKGQLVKGEQIVTIEVNGGARIQLDGQLTTESGVDRGDIDRITPGTQAKVTNGLLKFKLVAPSQPDSVTVRVSSQGLSERTIVRYVPDLREMLVVGLIEGRLRSDKFDPNKIVPVREDDSFDQEIKNFSKEFNGGRTNFGARAAMYLKGKISGDYLLTLAYDSEKDTRKQLFESIDPNAFYPVYGDSSLRTQDAQSSGKLFVRVDKNRNYLLFGDFTTQDPNPARRLGQYNRSLPGLRAHYEEGDVVANGFLAQESFKQVIDEFPARGVSGPYSVSNPNGIKGSEKVEIVVRKRDQTSVVLKTTSLARESDYEFEPFNGQILFRSPVPSVDDQLNPVSIRITYEVEQDGKRYLVYGVDGQYKLTERLTLGAAIAKDSNPVSGQTVMSANLALKLSKNTEIIAEIARSNSVVNTEVNGFSANNSANFLGKSGSFDGNAARLELRHADEQVRGNVYVQIADKEFNNAASGLTGGKQEFGGAVSYKATESVTLTADLQRSKDKIVGSENNSASIVADLKLTERLSVGAGVRKVDQNLYSVAQQAVNNCLINGSTVSVVQPYTGSVPGYNTGFGISQVGNQTIDPATGLPVICNSTVNPTAAAAQSLDRTSVFLRAGYQATDKLIIDGELQNISGTDATKTAKLGLRYGITKNVDLSAEVQREFGGDSDNNLYRLGADWRVAEKTRLYTRYENAHTYGGSYGLGIGPLNRQFALGIDTQYMQDGSLYSEYRLNDSASGRSIQNAIGLRNGWNVAEGLRFLTNAERINSTSGDATSLGVGLEYTANPLWKGSGRIQWREDQDYTNWLLTLSAARKLDRDWTLIAREYFNWIDPRNGSADTRQNRFQLGFAFRPVDNNKFDALGLYENKRELNSTRDNNTDIISLRANYHPSRPWWVTGRYAFKRVNELLNGVSSSYSASLIGGRVTYDMTNRWSVGGITTVMVGKGGARQYAYGLEVGYTLMDNLLVGLGYNWRGFRDDDLTGSDYSNRGWVLNVRYKFDEDVFKGSDRSVNRTLDPQGAPAVGTGAGPAPVVPR